MCGCRKNKTPAQQQTMALQQQAQRVRTKVRLQNFSDFPRPLSGKSTKVAYGKHKNGDELTIWKKDQLATPTLFEVIQEEAT